MFWLLIFLGFLAGMLLPVQAGVNFELRTVVGHPIVAGVIQFLVGALGLLVLAIALRSPLPPFARFSAAPWWVWVGGLLGANYIVIAILLVPRIGAATLLAVSVAGQMVVSLLLDHHGLIGYPVHPLSPWRIVGAGLLLAGVGLIQRF
jgi:bacterial/archaeal transporter family-2 protein